MRSNDEIERQLTICKEKLWITCPVCGKKTHAKAYADTVLIRFPLYCPKCKAETMINALQLKMVVSKEPDT